MKPGPLLIACFLCFFSLIQTAKGQIIKTDNPWLTHDKMIHFTYSMTLSSASAHFLEFKGVKHSEAKAVALVFGVGIAKEFLVDDKASFRDITVDLAGCITGILLNRLIMNSTNKRHAKKIQPSLPLQNP